MRKQKPKISCIFILLLLILPQNHIVLVLHIVAAITNTKQTHKHLLINTRAVLDIYMYEYQCQTFMVVVVVEGVFIVLPTFITSYTTILLVQTKLFRRVSIMARMSHTFYLTLLLFVRKLGNSVGDLIVGLLFSFGG